MKRGLEHDLVELSERVDFIRDVESRVEVLNLVLDVFSKAFGNMFTFRAQTFLMNF